MDWIGLDSTLLVCTVPYNAAPPVFLVCRAWRWHVFPARWKYQGPYHDVLRYISISYDANIKLVQVVQEHTIFYDRRGPFH